jgi:hypothetical protein
MGSYLKLKPIPSPADKLGETQYGSAGQNTPAAYLRERTRVELGQGGTM